MRIVLGVDGSAASRVACDLFASRSWPLGAHVRLVAAIEPVVDWTGLAPSSADATASRRAAIAITLEEQADAFRRRGLTCEAVIEEGRPAEVLLQHADELLADLIIVGSRGLGTAASALLGSVSAHLVDHAPCPVLVARRSSASRMLLASDGTRSSLSIPRILASWRPAFDGMPVEVVSIGPPGERAAPSPRAGEDASSLVAGGRALHRRIAEGVADEMLERGWTATALARAGDPRREIISAAEGWGADLIVTGSRDLGTLQRLVRGSVSHSVLLHTHASVLVVRGQVVARRRVPARAAMAPV